MLHLIALARMAIVAILMTGCAAQPRQFTVATADGTDPLIFTPGTAPDGTVAILLPDLQFVCGERPVTVTITRPDASATVTFTLTRRLMDQRNLGTEPLSVYARFNKTAYTTLAEEISPRAIKNSSHRRPAPQPGIHEALVAGLIGDKNCALHNAADGNDAAGAQRAAHLAARRILRDLPRLYSSVASYAYNHQVTGSGRGGPNDGSNGSSIDLFPGMRLRIEHSVPIGANGINTAGHPSTFAAPAFIYFNGVSRSEVCDVDIRLTSGDNNHLCTTAQQSEQTMFVSPSAEMLRLGARQSEGLIVPPDAPKVQQTMVSNVIDLYERSDTRLGVWKVWRLWFPNSRPVEPSTPFTKTGGGSKDSDMLPVLMAAKTHAALDMLTQRANADRCADDLSGQNNDSWHCYLMYFRVAPVPEIVVRVNGAERWVPVGTTLHNIVAPLMHADTVNAANQDGASEAAARLAERATKRLVERVRVRRIFEGAAYPVRAHLLHNGLAASRFLRLQLLPGDDISW